jgi:hypothetical protein
MTAHVTSIRIEKEWVDLARHLNLSLQDATVKGIKSVCDENLSKLKEEHIAFLSQHHRKRIEKHQEDIMHLERVGFDAQIREQMQKKRKSRVEVWDGKEVIVSVSE